MMNYGDWNNLNKQKVQAMSTLKFFWDQRMILVCRARASKNNNNLSSTYHYAKLYPRELSLGGCLEQELKVGAVGRPQHAHHYRAVRRGSSPPDVRAAVQALKGHAVVQGSVRVVEGGGEGGARAGDRENATARSDELAGGIDLWAKEKKKRMLKMAEVRI